MDRQTGEHFNKIKGKRMVKRKKIHIWNRRDIRINEKEVHGPELKKSPSYHSISHEHWSE